MLSKSKPWRITKRPVSARIDADLLESLEQHGWPKNSVINYILREYLVACEYEISKDPSLVEMNRWRRFYPAEVNVKI